MVIRLKQRAAYYGEQRIELQLLGRLEQDEQDGGDEVEEDDEDEEGSEADRRVHQPKGETGERFVCMGPPITF